MYLEEVKDLSKVEMGKDMVLVEFITEERVTKSEEEGVEDTVELVVLKEVVIKSTNPNIVEGDIIIEARYPVVDKKESTWYYEHDGRMVAIVPAYDIKMWTKSENFKG